MEEASFGRLQDKVHSVLPEAIERVLDTYRRLSDRDMPIDSKEVTAWQNACRATLAHLDLLFRAVRATEPPQPTVGGMAPDGRPDMSAMLAEARRVVDIMRGPNPPEEI